MGGQAGTSSRIENYLGFPTGISGADLTERAVRQAKRFGAELILTRRVSSVERMSNLGYRISLDGEETITGRTIILATGTLACTRCRWDRIPPWQRRVLWRDRNRTFEPVREKSLHRWWR